MPEWLEYLRDTYPVLAFIVMFYGSNLVVVLCLVPFLALGGDDGIGDGR